MHCIDETIKTIRDTAERVGLTALALEAGVPYTTLQTFAKRGWSHKSLTVLVKLASASDRLTPANDASETEAAA